MTLWIWLKRVFPAPAGINRSQLNDVCVFERVPRASGDKPTSQASQEAATMCSPRQRG
ncbi:hypothetical protein HWF18_004523 [Salmonella enterica]|nr:hypothetical protein [Salmonella enterica]